MFIFFLGIEKTLRFLCRLFRCNAATDNSESIPSLRRPINPEFSSKGFEKPHSADYEG